MTNKLFDSFVSNKLNNYESPVPEGLWEKSITEKERKPKFIFWWNNRISIGISAFLILVCVGYLGYNILSSKEELSSHHQLSGNKKNVEKNDLLINSVTENRLQNASPNVGVEATENDQNLNEKNASLSKEKKVEIANIVEENNLSVTIKTSKKTFLNSATESSKNMSFFDKNSLNKDENKSVVLNDKNSHQQKLIFKKNKAFLNKIEPNSDFSLDNDFALLFKPKANDVLMFVENNLAETNNLKENKVFDLRKLFSGTDDCPTTRGTYRNDTYLEGYFSPDFAFKNVTSTKVGNETYLQKKDSSETMQMGFTIGARFSKSLTNNLLLKAGLQYSQMNEKFTLRTENDRRQTVIINTRIIVRSGQSDTTISDTSVFVQIGYRVRTSMNYYKNLEILLMLSYEFPSQESKWKFAINGGAILSVTSWYEGKTIDASYNLVNIGNKTNNGFYRHQFGVSLYGGFSVIRNITPQLDVFAEPYFRYGLYNIQSSVGFNQRFNLVGLQLGGRLKLNKNRHL